MSDAIPSSALSTLIEASPSESRSTASLYLELTKPRLNGLVLVTTAVGYLVALPRTSAIGLSEWLTLLHVVIGTALCAGAGAVLNQWMEVVPDSAMERTRTRPLPAGLISPEAALRYATALCMAGTVWLAVFVNGLAALIAFGTVIIYALIYTPMKSRTSLCTLVGAIPGATPTLIGWAAVQGDLDVRALSLFIILFVWQMPHFFAIGWMYREDYARAGYPMLPVVDLTGRVTSAAILSWSLILLPVTALPFQMALFGIVYLAFAMVLGLGQLVLAFWLIADPSRSRARIFFFYTITYLPILMAVMVVDARLVPLLSGR